LLEARLHVHGVDQALAELNAAVLLAHTHVLNSNRAGNVDSFGNAAFVAS